MTNPIDENRSLPPAPSIPPRASDPIAMAGLTVQAVEQIGEVAAVEIEALAGSIERGALEFGDSLRELAAAMREICRTVGERVDDFNKRATDTASTVRALQGRLNGGRKAG